MGSLGTAALGYDGRPEANKEDILNMISNISPLETRLLDNLGRETANDFVHIFLTDSLKSVGPRNFPEGGDYSFASLSNPARVLNYTQIIVEDISVSDTEMEIPHYGMEGRLPHEKKKALKNWGNFEEYALMRSSLVCGSGNATARSMRGVLPAITTYATNESAVSLSETMLNDYLETIWTNTSSEIDEIYTSMRLKRRISQFSGPAGTQKTIALSDKRLVNAVDVYEADASGGRPLKLFAHKWIVQSAQGDYNHAIVGVNTDLWRVAFLRNRLPKFVDVAKVASATRVVLEGESTLEDKNEKGNFKTTGLV